MDAYHYASAIYLTAYRAYICGTPIFEYLYFGTWKILIMEILGKLGIDIKLLIAQIINFGLLLWLLKKFLYSPIIKRIEKDERELNEAKIQTEKLEKEKARFQEQKTRELAQTRKKAAGIVAEAEKIAGKIKEHAQKETEEEKKKVLQQIHNRLKNLSADS